MSGTSVYGDLCGGDSATLCAVGLYALEAAHGCGELGPITTAIIRAYIDEYLGQEASDLGRLGDYLGSLGLDAPAIDALSAEDLGRIVGTAAAHHALADIEWAAEEFDRRMYADDPSLDGLALGLASGGTRSHEGGDER